MSANVYAAPEAELVAETAPAEDSLWRPEGRLGVRSYWARQLVLALIFLVPLGMLGGAYFAMFGGGEPNVVLIGLVVLAVSLPYMWMSTVLTARRLHDVALSGWWMLLFLVPLVGILFSLYALLKPGAEIANRFGAARPTLGWEKIVGTIALVLYALMLVLPFAGSFLAGGA